MTAKSSRVGFAQTIILQDILRERLRNFIQIYNFTISGLNSLQPEIIGIEHICSGPVTIAKIRVFLKNGISPEFLCHRR